MPPSVFSSLKGKRLSFVLPSCFMILSEALCLEGTQDWESWWVPVPYGSHMELELQHGRNCCSSSLNPSAHQWLSKTGQRDLDQAAWLWQGSWANLSPFDQPKALLLEQGWVIQYLDVVSVSQHLDFGWLLTVKWSYSLWPVLFCAWPLAVRLR